MNKESYDDDIKFPFQELSFVSVANTTESNNYGLTSDSASFNQDNMTMMQMLQIDRRRRLMEHQNRVISMCPLLKNIQTENYCKLHNI